MVYVLSITAFKEAEKLSSIEKLLKRGAKTRKTPLTSIDPYYSKAINIDKEDIIKGLMEESRYSMEGMTKTT